MLTLARLVDLPTPLTPQNVIEYGRPRRLAANASLRMSTRRRGDNICTSDSSSPDFTVDDIP